MDECKRQDDFTKDRKCLLNIILQIQQPNQEEEGKLVSLGQTIFFFFLNHEVNISG